MVIEKEFVPRLALEGEEPDEEIEERGDQLGDAEDDDNDEEESNDTKSEEDEDGEEII